MLLGKLSLLNGGYLFFVFTELLVPADTTLNIELHEAESLNSINSPI